MWLDANVFLDFWSTVSIDKNASAGPKAVEATRVAMREAAWIAMAFDHLAMTTKTLIGEAWDHQMKQRAAPGSPAGAWSAAVTYIVKEYVCPAWDAKADHGGMTTVENEVERPTTNDERDDYMIADALANGSVLITRDRKARNKARTQGVVAMKPADYAQSIISLADARARYLERLDAGLLFYAAPRFRDERTMVALQGFRAELGAMWRL